MISRLQDLHRRLRSEEDGVTMSELLVGMFVGMIVITALYGLIDASNRSTYRTTARVDANQRARPVVTNLIDSLHSSCVFEGVAPIQAGSTDSELRYINEVGDAAVVDPEIKIVTYSARSLVERVYPKTGGIAPVWTFAGAPAKTTTLITKVDPADTGGPVEPIFRYYRYLNGAIDPTPLPTPLSAANAERVVQVDIAMKVSPNQNPTADAGAAVTLRDSAVLRLSPAGQDPTQENLPCL